MGGDTWIGIPNGIYNHRPACRSSKCICIDVYGFKMPGLRRHVERSDALCGLTF